jgi:hypothetical protein
LGFFEVKLNVEGRGKCFEQLDRGEEDELLGEGGRRRLKGGYGDGRG